MPPKPPQSAQTIQAVSAPNQTAQAGIKKKKESKWGKVSSNDTSFMQSA